MRDIDETRFLQKFPFFRNGPRSMTEIILSASALKRVPADVPLKMEGDYCTHFVLVLNGEKRIYKRSTSGREITLYEIGAGDICVLNATCILSSTALPVNADSLSEVSMLLLPASVFLRLMAEYSEMRTFVFGRINESLISITSLITEITFGKMDERLNAYLIEKCENGVLRTTHQKIADDLGTSREVVSRLLKDFERKGLVGLSRNLLRIRKI